MMKTIEVFSRKEFRDWLRKNHEKESKVAVIIHKKHTGRSFPTHREMIEEAICFGWIDTTIKRLDEDKYIRTFTKRNKNSRWSDNTLRYAKELVKKKKMMPAGMKYYKEGLKKPTHDAGISKNPSMPEELRRALGKRAMANFEKYPPSTKKLIYRLILRGKRKETRAKRIKNIVEKAKKGDKDIFSTSQKVNS